jgi:hypothetical protein
MLIAAIQNTLGQLLRGNQKEEELLMKTKRLLFINCLAAGALIASPSFGKPAKKSAAMSQSKATRVAPHTTQVMRHNQNMNPRTGGTRYNGTRSYATRQYSATRNYGGTRYYGNYYGGGTSYYNGGYAYPSYSYYSGWPYSNWGYGTSSGYYPYSYGGGYPYSGYNNYYSYYTPTYGYNGSTVAAVQQRLGRLGYYHGVVDGVMGPQTRSAIAAFESRNGMTVDGTISRPLLDTLGLA